jgi:hypothetical protein
LEVVSGSTAFRLSSGIGTFSAVAYYFENPSVDGDTWPLDGFGFRLGLFWS